MKKQFIASKAKEKTSRQQQAEQTKKKLLSVSLELMKAQGFENVKISDICEKVGVSTGAFYHHLTNKAGIVIEAYDQCDQYFKNSVSPIFADRYDIDAIADYIDYQIQYAIDMGADLTTQMYKAQLQYGTEFFLSQERGLPNGLLTIIRNLQEHQILSSDKSAEALTNEFLVISRGVLYNWCLNNGSYDPKSFSHEIIAAHLKAYTL